MNKDYEQMEFDTRSDLDKALSTITEDAVENALDLIQKNCETSDDNLMPKNIRNRYEAYGVAAEQTVSTSTASKAIKADVEKLLRTLSDPNWSAVDAAGSIYNSMVFAAQKFIQAAAIMKRTMGHLYAEESGIDNKPTPLEECAAENDEPDYQEADSEEADGDDEEFNDDEEDTEE